MADVADQAAGGATKAKSKDLSEAWFAWALIAPAMMFIGIIVTWPLVETIRLSFTDADLGGESWVGFATYEKMLSCAKFCQIVGRTFFWMVLSVSLKLIVGLIGATLLNASVPVRALFRMMIMPPWVISIAIVATSGLACRWSGCSFLRPCKVSAAICTRRVRLMVPDAGIAFAASRSRKSCR